MGRLTRSQATVERLVRAELDACSVGRDNPFHRALVTGEVTLAGLTVLAPQQWYFHRTFPGALARMAADCPDHALRGRILGDALEQDTGRLTGGVGRVRQWEQVAACWGISTDDLREGPVLPQTHAMVAMQRWTAQQPFGEAYLALLVATYVEAYPHMAARRQAMSDYYGVTGDALEYFAMPEADLPLADVVATSAPYLDDEAINRALICLRLVLRARFDYFSAIGARCG
jgi:pyrroloquinoline quinone (PQQ) biosynthesis protein C